MVDIKKIGDRGFNIWGWGWFEGAKLTKLPNFRTYLNWYFMLQNFRTFLKWYQFCFIFSHFAQIGSTVFIATSTSVPFGVKKSKGG